MVVISSEHVNPFKIGKLIRGRGGSSLTSPALSFVACRREPLCPAPLRKDAGQCSVWRIMTGHGKAIRRLLVLQQRRPRCREGRGRTTPKRQRHSLVGPMAGGWRRLLAARDR